MTPPDIAALAAARLQIDRFIESFHELRALPRREGDSHMTILLWCLFAAVAYRAVIGPF